MEDESQEQQGDVRSLIRDTIQEFMQAQRSKTEPAYKAELVEERRRREELERRVNELAEENRRSRQVADEAERATTIRAELQRLGVGKIDLAFLPFAHVLSSALGGDTAGATPERCGRP